MLQPERDRCFEKAELVAAIEAPALEAQPVKGLALVDQLAERVGQLDLPAAAWLGIGEVAKNLRLDDVAADNRQCRRRLGGIGLLDDPARPHQAAVVGDDVEHAVARGVRPRHLDDCREIAAGARVCVDHLCKTGLLTDHQIVGQEYRERLVSDERTRTPHRVAEAERGLLPRIGDLPGFGQPCFELCEHVLLAPLAQRGFKLEGAVKMIVDRALAPARHKEELLDACRLGLLDGVMNKRLVDDRQHLLGHRLGRRQKPGAQPGDRENGLADRFVHELLDRVPSGRSGQFICHETSPSGKPSGAYSGGTGLTPD